MAQTPSLGDVESNTFWDSSGRSIAQHNLWASIPNPLTLVVLFATTGIGNGSTFRMIPIIFSREQAGPVLGWTSAIAAYGAYLIPKIFATQIEAGTPEYALYGFAVYYASCLAVNWWYYARNGAEIKC